MSVADSQLPERIATEQELDEFMTRPRAALIDFVRTLKSPLVVLGAGGKMGPSLAVLVQRAATAASHPLEVIAVSRFTDATSRRWLEERGVRTISADLFQRSAVAALPDSDNVIYLVGLKFGTSQNPARTWAANTFIPALVAEHYARAGIVALSTGNVYPLTPMTRGGSVETDALTPLGEYANAAVGRERVFEYFSQQNRTRLALVRLNYALDLRYGVLVDIARKVLAGEPVDVTMGHVNCIWQGDANEMIVRMLGLADVPALALNLTGPRTLSVRDLALRFGELLGKRVNIVGSEAETALLSNSARTVALLGAPPTPLETVLCWTARWLQQGGRLLGKPAHFEVRDGAF